MVFYNRRMIRKYATKNAFEATEDMLLVPMPAGRVLELEGFAGQVMSRFPFARYRLEERNGLRVGEAFLVGPDSGHGQYVSPYNLAFCGIHQRVKDGWQRAPMHLTNALDTLANATDKGYRATVATAGIPGTGFSGLRGDANPDEIRLALEAHALDITVYQDSLSGDRAALLTPEVTV